MCALRLNASPRTLCSLCLLVATSAVDAVADEAGADARRTPAAATAEEQSSKDAAKEHFLRGLEFARTDQNWDAALAEFLASRELFPTQVALLNAAISLTRLGRYDEALDMYDELHRLFDASMTAQERAVVDAEVDDISGRVGELRIVVSEPDAEVELDGRLRGRTPLGRIIRLAPGTHALRVTKSGYHASVLRLVMASQQRRTLEITLQPVPVAPLTAPASAGPARQPAPPATAPAPAPPAERSLYLEASAGAFMAPSFAGGAPASCASPPEYAGAALPSCRDRQRPLGPMFAVALGYPVVNGLELELSLGYLRGTERLTRSVVADGELGRQYASTDNRDISELSAVTAMVGLGHRFRWPVLVDARLRLGVARATLEQSNDGTFAISTVNAGDGEDVYTASQRVSVPERAEALWLPLLSPELRAGVQLSKRFSVSFGAALLVLVGPNRLRSGATSLSRDGQRRTSLQDVPDGFADGTDVRPGVIALPEEQRFGTTVALAPSLGARLEL